MPMPGPTRPTTSAARLLVLDGWRAISILLVLATHMLPLGPRRTGINESVGIAGMSLFFTLSGFLITSTLFKHPSVPGFIVKRLCRILPLAYVSIIVYMILQGEGWRTYLAHFLFIENYVMSYLTPFTGHFWSLCAEMHFYAFTAMVMLIGGKPALRCFPLFALVLTSLRVAAGARVSIITHLRVDEIFAGASLALVSMREIGTIASVSIFVLRTIPLWCWLILFGLSCHPVSGPWMYVRPYLGAAVVGHTLFTEKLAWQLLRSRMMRYVAEISYALYVIHPVTMFGWLGSGTTVIKYLKRPICFALTFGLAHVSTFHMERHFIALGKQISRHLERHDPSGKS